MSKRVSFFILAGFGLGFAWMLYEELQRASAGNRLIQTLSGWLVALVGFSVFLGVAAVAILTLDALRRYIRKSRHRLPPGVTMEAVLRELPYELVYFQGEDGYRIVDKRTEEVVDWCALDNAEEWLIGQYLKNDIYSSGFR